MPRSGEKIQAIRQLLKMIEMNDFITYTIIRSYYGKNGFGTNERSCLKLHHQRIP
jgi:hypothetical protein